MEPHVGIDVSLELSSLCVLVATDKIIREATQRHRRNRSWCNG